MFLISQSNFIDKYPERSKIVLKLKHFVRIFTHAGLGSSGFILSYLDAVPSTIHISASLPTFYMKYAVCAQNNRIPARM